MKEKVEEEETFVNYFLSQFATFNVSVLPRQVDIKRETGRGKLSFLSLIPYSLMKIDQY